MLVFPLLGFSVGSVQVNKWIHTLCSYEATFGFFLFFKKCTEGGNLIFTTFSSQDFQRILGVCLRDSGVLSHESASF